MRKPRKKLLFTDLVSEKIQDLRNNPLIAIFEKDAIPPSYKARGVILIMVVPPDIKVAQKWTKEQMRTMSYVDLMRTDISLKIYQIYNPFRIVSAEDRAHVQKVCEEVRHLSNKLLWQQEDVERGQQSILDIFAQNGILPKKQFISIKKDITFVANTAYSYEIDGIVECAYPDTSQTEEYWHRHTKSECIAIARDRKPIIQWYDGKLGQTNERERNMDHSMFPSYVKFLADGKTSSGRSWEEEIALIKQRLYVEEKQQPVVEEKSKEEKNKTHSHKEQQIPSSAS